jgi:hypothetical protein
VLGKKRGNSTDRVKAREIDSLEKRARRVFDSGGTYATGKNGARISAEEYAGQLTNRAEGLRGGFGRLQSKDRDPFAASKKELESANKHLAEIQRQLTAVDTANGPGGED